MRYGDLPPGLFDMLHKAASEGRPLKLAAEEYLLLHNLPGLRAEADGLYNADGEREIEYYINGNRVGISV